MKSASKKVLIWALSMLMALSAVSCAKTEESANTSDTVPDAATASSETETETSFMPDIARKNYGEELVVLTPNYFISHYCFPSEDEENENALNDELVERSLKIKEHLGTELVLIDDIDWLAYTPAVIRNVQVGDDAYQMVLTHPYQGIPNLITSNSILDFQDLPSVNLDAPYWSQSVMDSTKIHDHNYIGYNDFLLSEVHLVTFNKDMLKEQQMEEPYNLVRNREWTLDRLIEMSSGISVDLNNDNKMDHLDQYGISGWGWVPLIDFITASNIPFVVQDGDTYVPSYSQQEERVIDVIEKVHNMYTEDSSYFWKAQQHTEDYQLKMDSGRSLFGLLTTTELLDFRDTSVRIGVLPYPLYDSKQENYRSLLWNGQMCIPSSIRNRDMVSDTIELLAAYSAPVKVAFYEKLLGLKLSEAPDDSEMLDIVWKAQVSDRGMTLCNLNGMTDIIYIIPQMCELNRKGYASQIKRSCGSAKRSLGKFFDELGES